MTSPLLFLDTHFDHRRSDQERIASAKFVNEIVLGEPEALAILAGDMNDTPMSSTVEMLSQQWKQANTTPLATIPVDHPKQQIDYILIRPQIAWKVVEARVLDEAIASDHRALLVILEIDRD